MTSLDFTAASRYSVEQLTEAYNRARADYLVPMPMTPQRLAEYIHAYDINLDASIVAVVRREIIGLCMLGVRSSDGWITRLGVLPDVRKAHVGLSLTEQCLVRARQRSLKRIYLEVIIGNNAAYNLFARLGFKQTQRLLVLSRAPGPPPQSPGDSDAQAAVVAPITAEWVDHDRAVALAARRTALPAWTNRTETFRNVTGIKALHVSNTLDSQFGWISYEVAQQQLRRVLISPDSGRTTAPSYSLLYHLHQRFPQLAAVAENVPVDSPDVATFQAYGYVTSLERIEMSLRLGH